MRTKRTIRATFSDNTIRISLPMGWHELTPQELHTAYRVMDVYGETEDVRFHFLRLAYGITFDTKHTDALGEIPMVIVALVGAKPKKVKAYVSPEDVACWLEELNWMLEPGNIPVRLEVVGGATAVEAYFHGVDFRTYYMVENYYQGYIRTKNAEALKGAERLLYPGIAIEGEMSVERQINLLNWLAQIKYVFSRKFPNFFKPAGDGGVEPPNMLEIMNTQIRALTGGDVTKEDQINKIDCWRALTELDFKAKEAEEFRKLQHKTK